MNPSVTSRQVTRVEATTETMQPSTYLSTDMVEEVARAEHWSVNAPPAYTVVSVRWGKGTARRAKNGESGGQQSDHAPPRIQRHIDSSHSFHRPCCPAPTLCCSLVPPEDALSQQQKSMTENWLFIGNPGTGKSTLLNCLARRVVFPSGLSFGAGLTTASDTFVDPLSGIIYTDTPGLADRSAEQAAAEAITHALRTGTGRYKLCFVIRLQCGRIVCQDLVTMERVLNSIALRNVPFGIIINNVSPAQYRTLSSQKTEFKRVVTLVNSGKYSTPHVVIVPQFHQLVDVDDEIVEIPPQIRACIEQFPTAVIPPEAVADIWVRGFSNDVQDFDDRLSVIQNNERELEKVETRLEKHRPGFWEIALTTMTTIANVAAFAITFFAA